MHKIILFIKDLHIYKKNELKNAFVSFSKKEKIIFLSISLIAIISLITILSKINNMFMVDVPTSGGTITEGIIGIPILVNPVISISDADKDLTMLVYSGLMRKTGDGKFIPDLAEKYEVSNNETVYTFTIKKNAKFQNGDSVLADDIIFTIDKIKDPLVKSPRKSNWEGIIATKKDDYTVEFTLSKPSISFMENVTIGILPYKEWKDVKADEFNISPLNSSKAIGSGPYKITSLIKDEDDIPKIYELKRFNDFVLGKPFIKYINIVSYPNGKDLIKALTDGSIDQAGGINPEYANLIKNKGYKIETASLPRIFGIFFNKNNNKIFNDESVVSAINNTIDRQAIINQVLNGYGSIVLNPIPEKIISNPDQKVEYNSETISKINASLEKSGWIMGADGIRSKGGNTSKTITKKLNGKTITQTIKTNSPLERLSFSLTTGDTPELKKINLLIKEQLFKVGIEVNIEKVYEAGKLNQLIRARDYEALLFGQLINYESDLYSYWHSSQREDPGLNIAMYNNKKVDVILETIQKTLSIENRNNQYENLKKEFENNISSILIYSPKYLYITKYKSNNFSSLNITIPSDRFTSIYNWYTDMDKVWKIFIK
jgi:peptide/nickel transport system substrate-binding protein